MSDDGRPLYVVLGGGLTELASAFLLELALAAPSVAAGGSAGPAAAGIR